jgi:hypothetical protein
MKRSEYPSQKKYRENNPSISFRLKRQDKEKLDAIIEASCKPLSRWMTDFLHDKLDPNEVNSELADLIDCHIGLYKELYDELETVKTEARFSVPCSVCGKPMNFSSKDSDWTLKYYPVLERAFTKWHHHQCKPG